MRQRITIVVLAALLLLASSYLLADWLSGGGVPLVPAEIERAGFTQLESVRKTSGEDVGGAGSAIVFEAETESETDARILRVPVPVPCEHDPAPPAPPPVRIEVPGPERVIIERASVDLTASSLGGKCRLEVLERDGSWWTQALWTGWVNLEGGQRIQRGPIPAGNVLVAEVAKPYTPKRIAVTAFGGFQSGASEPGWYAGAVVRFRKHLGVTGYFARDFESQGSTYGGGSYGCYDCPPVSIDPASRNRVGVGVSWTF